MLTSSRLTGTGLTGNWYFLTNSTLTAAHFIVVTILIGRLLTCITGSVAALPRVSTTEILMWHILGD
jgi:hypothetical protein